MVHGDNDNDTLLLLPEAPPLVIVVVIIVAISDISIKYDDEAEAVASQE
jgi:hypothetical protein